MENVVPPNQTSVQNPSPVDPTSVDQQNDKPMLQSFSNQPKKNANPMKMMVLIGLLVIMAGIGTGYVIAKSGNGDSNTAEQATPTDANLATNEAGISDESHFEEDAPEGVLQEGGLNGEGTHHIDRNAGPDKIVYLTSAVINLDNFVGKKVKVWGNTIAAQEAPWLMDVGKIKVIE